MRVLGARCAHTTHTRRETHQESATTHALGTLLHRTTAQLRDADTLFSLLSGVLHLWKEECTRHNVRTAFRNRVTAPVATNTNRLTTTTNPKSSEQPIRDFSRVNQVPPSDLGLLGLGGNRVSLDHDHEFQV